MRPYNAPIGSDRCKAVVTLRDGSTAQCMKLANRINEDGFTTWCHMHAPSDRSRRSVSARRGSIRRRIGL